MTPKEVEEVIKIFDPRPWNGFVTALRYGSKNSESIPYINPAVRDQLENTVKRKFKSFPSTRQASDDANGFPILEPKARKIYRFLEGRAKKGSTFASELLEETEKIGKSQGREAAYTFLVQTKTKYEDEAFGSLKNETDLEPSNSAPKKNSIFYRESITRDSGSRSIASFSTSVSNQENTFRYTEELALSRESIPFWGSTQKLTFLYANQFIGKAVDDGGCFFDSLAQILNQLHDSTEYSEKSLRQACHLFYTENNGKNKEQVVRWLLEDMGSRAINMPASEIEKIKQDYFLIQYTKPELDKDFHQAPPIRGRPNVEGRILCRALGLNGIHVIEIIQDPESKENTAGHLLVTRDNVNQVSAEDSRLLGLPTLLVEQATLHFVPVLNRIKPALETLMDTDDDQISRGATINEGSGSGLSEAERTEALRNSQAPLLNPDR